MISQLGTNASCSDTLVFHLQVKQSCITRGSLWVSSVISFLPGSYVRKQLQHQTLKATPLSLSLSLLQSIKSLRICNRKDRSIKLQQIQHTAPHTYINTHSLEAIRYQNKYQENGPDILQEGPIKPLKYYHYQELEQK